MNVRMPNGTLIRNVPEGLTQAELLSRLSQGGYDTEALLRPRAVSTPTLPTQAPAEQDPERSMFDVPLAAARGATSGVKFLTDVFGAENVVSQGLGNIDEWLASLQSAGVRQDEAEIARIMQAAEDQGIGAQLRAAWEALKVAPVTTGAQVLGTALPTIAGGYLGGAARLGTAGVRAIQTGIGAGMGAGIIKSDIYGTVRQELLDAGVDEEAAGGAAREAQSYTGGNLDLIAGGAFLGGIAGRFGIEPALARTVEQNVARKLLGRVVRGAAEEALPEAAQAGQEQLAQNIALQREGFDVPTGRGVAGQAAFEGLAGAGIGAGVGAIRPGRVEEPPPEPMPMPGPEPEPTQEEIRRLTYSGGLDPNTLYASESEDSARARERVAGADEYLAAVNEPPITPEEFRNIPPDLFAADGTADSVAEFVLTRRKSGARASDVGAPDVTAPSPSPEEALYEGLTGNAPPVGRPRPPPKKAPAAWTEEDETALREARTLRDTNIEAQGRAESEEAYQNRFMAQEEAQRSARETVTELEARKEAAAAAAARPSTLDLQPSQARPRARVRGQTIEQELSTYIKALGGIRITRDPSGGLTPEGQELQALKDKTKKQGVLRPKSDKGMSPEDALRRLKDDRWLSEDADLNDMYDLIDRSLNVEEGVYHPESFKVAEGDRGRGLIPEEEVDRDLDEVLATLPETGRAVTPAERATLRTKYVERGYDAESAVAEMLEARGRAEETVAERKPTAEAPTPAAPAGMTRLYRMESTPEQVASGRNIADWIKQSPVYQNAEKAGGRWFTDDLDEINWYRQHEYPEGRMVYVDVPTAEAEKYRVSNIPLKPGDKDVADNPRAYSRRPDKEFFIPSALAAAAKPAPAATPTPAATPAPAATPTPEAPPTLDAAANELAAARNIASNLGIKNANSMDREQLNNAIKNARRKIDSKNEAAQKSQETDYKAVVNAGGAGLGRGTRKYRNSASALPFFQSILGGMKSPTLRAVLYSLTTSDIVRWFRGKLRDITVVDTFMKRMDSTRNRLLKEIAAVSPDWASLIRTAKKDADALADLFYDATINNIDPEVRVVNPTATERRVYAQYDNLAKNAKALAIFKSVKEQMNSAIDKRIKHMQDTLRAGGFDQAQIKAATEFLEIIKKERTRLKFYFPLMRFGRYWVSYNKGKDLEFRMFESWAERERFMKWRTAEAKANNEVLEETGRGDDPSQLRDLFGTNVVDQNSAIAKVMKVLNASGRNPNIDELKADVFQLYLQTLPDGDLRKHLKPRKNVRGYSTDALRTFVSHQVSVSNNLAALEYKSKVRGHIQGMYDQIREEYAGTPDMEKLLIVAGEMAARVERAFSPAELDGVEQFFDKFARWGNQASFYYFLTSARTALIQLTQVPIVTAPLLAREFKISTAQANALLAKRVSGKLYDLETHLRRAPKELRKAIEAAYKEGDDTGAFDTGYISDLTYMKRTPSTTSESSSYERLGRGGQFALKVLRGGFQYTESSSRKLAYMTAFELAYKRLIDGGMDADTAQVQAQDTAESVMLESLFDYRQWNKPRLMTATGAKLGTQFLTYPLQMYSLLARNFYNQLKRSGLSKEERRAARSTLAGVLLTTGLFGGVTALPLFSVALGVLDMLSDATEDDDDPRDPLNHRSWELWFRNEWLPQTFGTGSGIARTFGLGEDQSRLLERAVLYGPVSAITGLDISSSVSLDNIFFGRFDVGSVDKEGLENLVYANALGPFGGMLANWTTAASDFSDGEYLRGFENILPSALKQPLRAYRYGTEGNLTRRGDTVRSREFYTVGRLATQVLGFTPTEVKEKYDVDELVYTITEEANSRKYDALDAINKALEDYGQDSPEFDRAIQEARAYSQANPNDPITYESIQTSVNGRIRNRVLAEMGGGRYQAPRWLPRTMAETDRYKERK